MSFIDKLDKLFGDQSKKYIKSIKPLVDRVNALEPEYEKLTNEQLQAKTAEFRARLANGETLDNLLPEAFATVREASRRVIGQRHYDVQIMGSIALHQGIIAEMRTGEGKTLTSTLTVYLNALEGKGVHLVTVNDYLARRDASWMGQIYDFLGMSVGCIQNQLVSYVYDRDAKADVDEAADKANADGVDVTSELKVIEQLHVFKVDMDRLRRVEDRAESYRCDVIYGTNNEFGFDFLRDNMVQIKEHMVQRELHYAIVDEVDSILIDEARTPLIISAPDSESTTHYGTYAKVVSQLEENVDFNIDEKMNSVTFTEAGQEHITKILGSDPWVMMDYQTTFHIEAALKAKALYKREVDYVVHNDEVIIVDEFTGRMMYGRRYSEGLHQAIEAKENVTVQKESRTLATITFQNLFRMYRKLGGMTGTAETEKEEFRKIYGLDVISIPTNKKAQRIDFNDQIYRNEHAKFEAVIRDIQERHSKGQPILIGTISIEKNEILSNMLDKAGISHKLLNAKNHESEAEIIAQAGKKYAVTLATNMAGRGVDIILGGVPQNPEEAEEIRAMGGLHVIGTERHESRRIDNQLRGRTGRQGDPGTSRFYVCLDDDLMRIFGSDRIKSVMQRLNIPDDMPIENKIISRSLESAQKKVEGNNFDTRKRLVEYDDVINKQRKAIYEKRKRYLELANQEDAHVQYRESILTMIQSEVESVVLFHTAAENSKDWDIKEILEVSRSIFPYEIKESELQELKAKTGNAEMDAEARGHMIDHMMSVAKRAYDRLEEVITDKKMLVNVERGILLRSIDQFWISHLDNMTHLRTGIGLRGYGQKDPLVEYKKEAFGLYHQLNADIQRQVVYSIFKVHAAMQLAPSVMDAPQILQGAAKTASEAKVMDNVQGGVNSIAIGNRNEFHGEKVGRNDDCPCGSGLKYKKCHGK